MTNKIFVYIAGPMESVGGNMNFPLFELVAQKLRATGRCEVFSPADHAREEIGTLEFIMKLDKKDLKNWRKRLLANELSWICRNADVMLMLPGWQQSAGAKAERAVAEALEITIRELPNIILEDFTVDHFIVLANNVS